MTTEGRAHEARSRAAGDVDSGGFGHVALARDLSRTQRLAGCTFATEFNDATQAQRGLGRVHAAQCAGARKVLNLSPCHVLRGQALPFCAGLNSAQFGGLGGQDGITCEAAGDRFFQAQGFGGMPRQGNAIRAGKRQH